LIAVRVLEEAGVLRHAARVETSVAALFIAVAIAAGLAAGGGVRRAVFAGALLALGTYAALAEPVLSRLVFVHAHNVVALLLWVYLYARRRSALIPLAMIACAAALFASGALFRITAASPGISWFGLHALAVSDWIAPFSRPSLAIGAVCAYVFLQSVHYGVWLTFVPQEELRSEGSLTFRMSVRSLFKDLGVPGVVAAAIAALAVVGGAFFEVHRARALYLSLAMVHGYLELALLAYFFVRRAARGESAR
jgi:hypothetical protein